MNRRRRLFVLGAALWFPGGCSFAPPPEVPSPVMEIPDAYRAEADPTARDAVAWWRTFDDPVLDRLVDTALAANLDLREAVARMEELRSRFRIARSPLFPAVGLSGDVTRSSSPANTGFGGSLTGDGGEGGAAPDSVPGFPFSFPDRFEFTTYSASLGYSYELDFWGKLRNESGAAARDFGASRADVETIRIAVIAATISTYLEVVSARRGLALAEENVDLLRERAELTEQRYRAGLTGSFELYSIRQQYRTAQSELPGLETSVDDAEGRLAVILGRYAGTLGELLPDDLAPAPDTEPVPAGLPVALLAERPDVWAAFERLEAARLRVGARRAELLPSISLNGSVGFQSSEPANLFRADQWFLNLIGGIVAPLFQGGRLRANVGVADAQYEQLSVAYIRTVLEAFREVRTGLTRFDNERERYARVVDQVEEARASLDYQLERYRRGVGDYVSYLDARRNLVGARTALTQAERGLGEARLGVHRALGGAWLEPAVETTMNGGAGAVPGDRRER